MNSISFSAILESKEDDILEPGQAYISKDNSITFTSDFVPLLKLGSKVSVIRVIGEKRMECFGGKVYLSSRKLLRIVEVDQKLINQALELFDSNVILPTEFCLAPGSSTHFNIQKAKGISGFIRYISQNTVKICTMEFADKGQHLMFSLEESELELTKMMVVVKERILLMRSAAVLLCDVVSLSQNNSLAIRRYINHLEEEEQQKD